MNTDECVQDGYDDPAPELAGLARTCGLRAARQGSRRPRRTADAARPPWRIWPLREKASRRVVRETTHPCSSPSSLCSATNIVDADTPDDRAAAERLQRVRLPQRPWGRRACPWRASVGEWRPLSGRRRCSFLNSQSSFRQFHRKQPPITGSVAASA